jgi:hypothetical protein
MNTYRYDEAWIKEQEAAPLSTMATWKKWLIFLLFVPFTFFLAPLLMIIWAVTKLRAKPAHSTAFSSHKEEMTEEEIVHDFYADPKN